MATVDLTIRGAGIFGLSIAWEALCRGATVRLVDPHGVGAGSSGGVVGALAPHTPENWNPKKAFQFESLLRADTFWQGVEAVSGISSGYARTGRLQILEDDRAVSLARDREEGARTFWGDHATWRVVEAGDFGGWGPVSPTGLLVHDTLTARLNPHRACTSLAAAIVARGGEVVTEAEDEGAVVWATGWAGLRDLSEALAKPVGSGVKGQALTLKHRAPEDAPQVFVDGLHIVPHVDGTVAIGSTSEREFDDPASTDDKLDPLLEKAVEAMPILHGAPVVHRWAGVRPRARTRAPMLGAWPGRPGHFVANGGFKIGFGVAPKVAEVMTGLLLDGCDAIPEGFRVEDNL